MYIYIYISIFSKGNPLMEKPGNWYAIENMCEQHLKGKEMLSKTTRIFT